jgi:putative DNA primase/helicase
MSREERDAPELGRAVKRLRVLGKAGKMSSQKLTDLAAEGRAIVEQLGGRWSKIGGMCRCPAHDDTTPSLSVRVGRSRLLLHCFAGCSATEILQALQSRQLLEARGGIANDAAPVEPDGRDLAKSAMRIWSSARIIAETPAERYLRQRAILVASGELRFHPRTPLGPRPFTQFRPALIAAVRDETGLVGIHRTFLDHRTGRLATLPNPKLGLGRFGSGAVRLAPAAARLGLAEGLETALSAMMLFGMPCWATLGTQRFGLVTLPAGVRELVLFLDHDKGGRRAETLAREAFGDRIAIEARYPRRSGLDWNDVLVRSRRASAP